MRGKWNWAMQSVLREWVLRTHSHNPNRPAIRWGIWIQPLIKRPTAFRENWVISEKACHNLLHLQVIHELSCLLDYLLGGWKWASCLDRFCNGSVVVLFCHFGNAQKRHGVLSIPCRVMHQLLSVLANEGIYRVMPTYNISVCSRRHSFSGWSAGRSRRQTDSSWDRMNRSWEQKNLTPF